MVVGQLNSHMLKKKKTNPTKPNQTKQHPHQNQNKTTLTHTLHFIQKVTPTRP